jgi:hypothetical protein
MNSDTTDDNRPRCAWLRMGGGTCNHKADKTVWFPRQRRAEHYCWEHASKMIRLVHGATMDKLTETTTFNSVD